MRLTLAIAMTLAAGAAAAQEALAPEELAGFAAEICLTGTAEMAAEPDTGDFELVERGDEIARYVHPTGVALALAARPGFFSCEIEVREADEAYFDILITEFGERFLATFEADGFEQVEDGLVWQARTEAGTLVTTEAQQDEAGRITLTSSTETTVADEAPRDQN
ncbi:MAG: hypothetical protein ACOCYW_01720 [Roseicyclus sp.]